MVKNELERRRIGQRIAEIRKEQGITQKELAARCGLTQTYISQVEGGTYGVGIDLLANIVAVLGKRIELV